MTLHQLVEDSLALEGWGGGGVTDLAVQEFFAGIDEQNRIFSISKMVHDIPGRQACSQDFSYQITVEMTGHASAKDTRLLWGPGLVTLETF